MKAEIQTRMNTIKSEIAKINPTTLKAQLTALNNPTTITALLPGADAANNLRAETVAAH